MLVRLGTRGYTRAEIHRKASIARLVEELPGLDYLERKWNKAIGSKIVAMKATYGEISHPAEGPGGTGFLEPREIYKAPITDSGEKKSKKGLLKVCYDGSMETYIALGKPADGTMKPIICKDQQTSAEENSGLLETVFLDGKLVKTQTLSEIRERLKV
jgi:hypothetical protein